MCVLCTSAIALCVATVPVALAFHILSPPTYLVLYQLLQFKLPLLFLPGPTISHLLYLSNASTTIFWSSHQFGYLCSYGKMLEKGPFHFLTIISWQLIKEIWDVVAHHIQLCLRQESSPLSWWQFGKLHWPNLALLHHSMDSHTISAWKRFSFDADFDSNQWTSSCGNLSQFFFEIKIELNLIFY